MGSDLWVLVSLTLADEDTNWWINKLASLGYASPKLRNYDLITDLLTGVKCRATSVAKNLKIQFFY